MTEVLKARDYEVLFTPKTIGGMKAPNRFVAQPMEANDSDPGGAVSERALERYRKLARGGWGITVVEAISVTPECVARKNEMVINRKNLDGYKRLVDEYKRIHPDGLLLFQITHPGRKAGPFSRRVALYKDSDLEVLSEREVSEIRDLFVHAVNLSKEAGADGIDFKLCHGYFGCEMLRPANQRDDQWGGSFDDRTRFLRSSLDELRSTYAPGEFILGSRISMYEGVRGGCGTVSADSVLEDLTEMKRIISLMADHGADYLNVSAGIPGETSEITRPTNQSRWFYLHHFRYCREARDAAREMPLIGSAYTILKEQALADGAENIDRGIVDFIGFGRQIFADPLFPAKVKNGEPVDYCTSCSGCTKLMISQEHDGCIVYDPYYREVMRAMTRRNRS